MAIEFALRLKLFLNPDDTIVKIIFINRLALRGCHNNNFFNSRLGTLFNHKMHNGAIAKWQHAFWHCFGNGQIPTGKPRVGDNGFANRSIYSHTTLSSLSVFCIIHRHLTTLYTSENLHATLIDRACNHGPTHTSWAFLPYSS